MPAASLLAPCLLEAGRAGAGAGVGAWRCTEQAANPCYTVVLFVTPGRVLFGSRVLGCCAGLGLGSRMQLAFFTRALQVPTAASFSISNVAVISVQKNQHLLGLNMLCKCPCPADPSSESMLLMKARQRGLSRTLPGAEAELGLP